MSWRKSRVLFRRFFGIPAVLSGALLAAGCFQPLYSESPVSGRPALRDALSRVDIVPIYAPDASDEGRLAVQIRNDLLFNFTGGGASYSPTHRLQIQIAGARSLLTIDKNTVLPTIESYTLTTTYSLTELATGRVVVTGRASVPVSYDPSAQQRFARISALHDAERRAAKAISDNIATRLASYFVAGT